MPALTCPHCGHPHHFETQACSGCDSALAYRPEIDRFVALRPDLGWIDAAGDVHAIMLCDNARLQGCNWEKVDREGEQYCVACRHNRTVPDLSIPGVFDRWVRIEHAKRRLFRALLRLGLPLENKVDRPDGLAFDFLYDPAAEMQAAPEVFTGHDSGLVTLNIIEADDAARERMRTMMGERYRTLIGHFRHEVGHYFWDRLVKDSDWLDEFRHLFGDEQEDYTAALQRHYADGPPHDWQLRFISSYAASHPWEDFAESFAHYLHIVDSLATVARFDLLLPAFPDGAERADYRIDFNPHQARTAELIQPWIPFSFLFNAVNRTMGQPEFYPFDLTSAVVVKLDYINRLVHDWRDTADQDSVAAIMAMMRGLARAPEV